MKFSVSSSALLSLLATTGKVISNKNTLPILDYFLMELNGNTLKVTTSGCVALTSVSGEPLDRADRLVLIYSTCVANSGMRLSSDRSTMIRRGETPVLLETGRLELEFRTAGAEQFELYALRMDGSRSEKLPLAVRDGKLAIRIDTAKLAAGPTVFFELVKKK